MEPAKRASRSRRVTAMLSQEQLKKYQSFRNNADKTERHSSIKSNGDDFGFGFPDTDGMLTLKLFLSIEVLILLIID